MGVERKGNKFQARYIKDGKRITVGTFKSKSEARRQLAIARGDTVFVSDDNEAKPRKQLQVKDFKKGVVTRINNITIAPQPLVISKPRPITTWGRIKTWLKNRKAN